MAGKAMSEQQIRSRYHDPRKLKELLDKFFPNGDYQVLVRADRWIVLTSTPLTPTQLSEINKPSTNRPRPKNLNPVGISPSLAGSRGSLSEGKSNRNSFGQTTRLSATESSLKAENSPRPDLLAGQPAPPPASKAVRTFTPLNTGQLNRGGRSTLGALGALTATRKFLRPVRISRQREAESNIAISTDKDPQLAHT